MGHIHVRDRTTGHQYVIAEHLYDPAAHELTGKPTRDRHGDLVPAKPRLPLGVRAYPKPSVKPAGSSGHKAETDKE